MSGIMENSPSTLPRASSVGLSDIFLFDQANGDGTYTTRGVPLAVLGPALAGAIAMAAGAFNGAIFTAFLAGLPKAAPAQANWWNNNGVPTYGQAVVPASGTPAMNFSTAANSQNLSFVA